MALWQHSALVTAVFPTFCCQARFRLSGFWQQATKSEDHGAFGSRVRPEKVTGNWILEMPEKALFGGTAITHAP